VGDGDNFLGKFSNYLNDSHFFFILAFTLFLFHWRTPSCVAMPIIATKEKFPPEK